MTREVHAPTVRNTPSDFTGTQAIRGNGESTVRTNEWRFEQDDSAIAMSRS